MIDIHSFHEAIVKYKQRLRVNMLATHNSPLSTLIHEENNHQRFKIERQSTIENLNNLLASTSPATAEFIARFRLEHEHNHQVYADIIDEETDDVTIIYLGELEWKFLKINFTNILQFIQKQTLISRSTLLNYQSPIFDDDCFEINSNGISGEWKRKSECIFCEKLFENADGYILWECFIPVGLAQINVNNKINKGLGYVEKLTMTIKPWRMPIDILGWGRFLYENQYIIWIRWIGKEEKFLIFHNGIKYSDGIINDEMIEFGNYRLLLIEKYILRNGLLSETIFDRFIWIKKFFPLEFLDINECKWETWSELYEKNCLIAKGWSIHENVNFKSEIKNHFGKMFYGFLFTILIPLLLIFWSKQTEKLIVLSIPTTNSIVVSLLINFFGIILIVFAMLELWFQGDGLPMNAYPPSKLVMTGVYKIFSHPIYIGSSLICFGLSMYYESKSGFWFVSPLLTLSWISLVYGYENEDLKQRFRQEYTWKTLLNIPENVKMKCEYADIISIYCLVFLPWFIFYEILLFIGPPSYSISTYFIFENNIPVIEWTELFYLLTYPYVLFLPFILETKQQVRCFIIDSLMNTSIGIYLQFILPFVAPPKQFIPKTILGEMLLYERSFDGPGCAFPSFHVSWAFLSAYYYSWIYSEYNFIFYILSVLISLSCITTGMHSILDVVGGGILGSLIVSWFYSIPLIRILSAYALASPWIQGVGRFRCIIHGCCHGRSTNKFFGILITNSQSRVCSLSKLKNEYIHITQGYSILSNLIIGMLLWRLWYSNISLYVIISLYFILIGQSRFIEERFRGEIQTKVYCKLKICQWLSILFVLVGIFISMISFDNDTIQLNFMCKYEYLIPSILFGFIATFALAIDFPESKKRFSRLCD
ncbi:unnamed protein product [Adineta steineri]|uniref:Phosphatidic acid phosphatase type 2/haloperoxidase domain-containing protein n=1 Tax=Adineta steineri TaxID=433720 RepID=A0A815ASL9_9BILA|nr:unnamed protein product [Adineta steineri]CAF1552124.1 unnamed protein product [Adineta steineri]